VKFVGIKHSHGIHLDEKLTVMSVGAQCLPEDVLIRVISLMRAKDMLNLIIADPKTFNSTRISRGIVQLITEAFLLPSLPTISDKHNVVLDPRFMFQREVLSVQLALKSPQPLAQSGLWISSSWLSSARRFYDYLKVKYIEGNNKRAGAAPPRPLLCMTEDIVCSHGGLGLPNGSDFQRRPISSKMWKVLRRLYPNGPEFKCAETTTCEVCVCLKEEEDRVCNEEMEMHMLLRRQSFLPPGLEPLAARKCGFPLQCTISNSVFLNDDNYESDGELATGALAIYQNGNELQPLVPGLYNVIPKVWLKSWRRYLKESNSGPLPPLDCTSLLCQRHEMLVVPPHLQEYLTGLKRSLLTGTGYSSEQVVEIVSAEEWDLLQETLDRRVEADCTVRFCLDGTIESGVIWNTTVCVQCDPYSYATLKKSLGKDRKRGPNTFNSARNVSNI